MNGSRSKRPSRWLEHREMIVLLAVWIALVALFWFTWKRSWADEIRAWIGVPLTVAGVLFLFVWPLAPDKLRVLTGLAGEELAILRDLIDDFARDRGLRAEIVNKNVTDIVEKSPDLSRFHLITWDITWRGVLPEVVDLRDVGELLRAHNRMLPTSLNPAVLPYLHGRDGETQLFVPFRINVQLVFVNRRRVRLADEDPGASTLGKPPEPRSWCGAADFAERTDGKLLIQAKEHDRGLFLLQLLRSAGLRDDLRELSAPGDGGVSEDVLRETFSTLARLYEATSDKARHASFDSVAGFLVADSVWVARNWAFTLSILRQSTRMDDFAVRSGLPLARRPREDERDQCEPRVSNLLGGELLAVPRRTPSGELSAQLVTFLLSKKVQSRLVSELSWPAMRMDVVEDVRPREEGVWDELQETIKDALLHAAPTPDYWSVDVADAFDRAFDCIVGECSVGHGHCERQIAERLSNDIEEAGSPTKARSAR